MMRCDLFVEISVSSLLSILVCWHNSTFLRFAFYFSHLIFSLISTRFFIFSYFYYFSYFYFFTIYSHKFTCLPLPRVRSELEPSQDGEEIHETNNYCNNNENRSKKNNHIQLLLNHIIKTVRNNVILPLSLEIENDLRLNIQVRREPESGTIQSKSEFSVLLKSFLDAPPLRILYYSLDIKNEITRYLDRNFYNLITVAIPDSRTYSEMKILAHDRFGLKLIENYLPLGSLGQGLDLLFIMRNIDIFVASYSYDMNIQNFIENKPDSTSSIKYLNIIDMKSIVTSIRQHGLGVVSTTINCTYQFLTKKFHEFSQILFNEYLKGHLVRESKWFKKHKNEVLIDNIYPYERSVQFANNMKRLGNILISLNVWINMINSTVHAQMILEIITVSYTSTILNTFITDLAIVIFLQKAIFQIKLYASIFFFFEISRCG